MAQNHNRLPARRAIIFRCERASMSGADAEDRKEVVGNKLSRNLLRFLSSSLAAQQKPFLGGGDQAGEDLRLIAEEDVIGERETSIAFIRRPIFQPDYRVRVVDRQGAQLSVEKSKNACVDPNAQRQGERNHDGEARLFTESAYGVAQILPQVCDHIYSPAGSEYDRFRRSLSLHVPQFLLKHFTPAQFGKSSLISFRFRYTAREQLVVTIIEILRKLFDDSGFAHRRKIQRLQSSSDFGFPLRHS